MANRLVKRGITAYVPAVPSRPYQPAYCIELPKVPSTQDQIRVPPSGHGLGWTEQSAYGSSTLPSGQPLTSENAPVYDADGRLVGYLPVRGGGSGASSGTQTTYTGGGTQCFPAVPAVQGSAAQVHSTPILGWNGGARSIDILTGDCYASFTIDAHPVGVVCGFAPNDTSTAFNEATHAFYAHGSTIQVVESGTVVATVSGASLIDHPTLIIRRESGRVSYHVGSWMYVSAVQSTGPVLLDATLYATGDTVDNPVFAPLSVAPPMSQVGEFDWTLPLLALLVSEDEYGQFNWLLPPLGFESSATQSGFNRFEWVLPALDLLVGKEYAQLELRLPKLVGEYEGGFPQFTVAGFSWVLPPVIGSMVGLVGAVGGFDWSLPPFTGWLADRPYAAMQGVLGAPLEFYADTGPAPGGYGVMEPVYTADFLLPDGAFYAELYDGLEVGDDYSLVFLIHEDIYDGLMVSDFATAAQLLQAAVSSGLVVNSNAARTTQEAVQYATNLESGALTRYTGFDFAGFARTDYATYGFKADGLYRIGGDTDDGALRDALLDLGTASWNVNVKKHIPTVFLGLGTDGEAYVRMTPDKGAERIYRVIQRRDVSRANPHRGLTAREWSVQLQIVDASSAVLDNIEFIIEVSPRRWTR